MKYILIFLVGVICNPLIAKTIYLDIESGDNTHSGLSSQEAFKDLSILNSVKFEGGDSILLASGQVFKGMIALESIYGVASDPVVISTFSNSGSRSQASIDAEGREAGVRLINCSGVKIHNISITANGGLVTKPSRGIGEMRCGILVLTNNPGEFKDIAIDQVEISDVFYPESGYKRGKEDVKTANGKQPYGWGIRVISSGSNSNITNVIISNSKISNVGHTAIKFTGRKNNEIHSIQNIQVSNNNVSHSGGPGIQMSGIKNGHIYENIVDHSGSTSDSRKWGRGSGLWTWGSENVLIERNRFTSANGPADSAGAHIDFNCRNVVMQYNYSANNAGGFCEILGNNYNCIYRYNVSVNDGHRVKGKDDAFQEGKIFWLSGYQGDKERNGPYNSYFYNNTIYVSQDVVAKIAVTKVSAGVLIANNIFHIEGESQAVLGDQYNPEKTSGGKVDIPNVVFRNNLFLKLENWPENVLIQPQESKIGNADFSGSVLQEITSFTPRNANLIKNQGIEIVKLPGDEIGSIYGLSVKKDVLGNLVDGRPDIGAIEIK